MTGGILKEKAMKMVLMTVFAAVVAAASAASSAAPRRVLCWGDSVTEGMAMPRGKDYPAQLQSLLGEGYRVLNSGDGGENSVTIPVRQGAYRIVTADAITFPAGETTVTIGDAFDNGFHTIAGEKIMLTAALGRMIPVNPVEIGGETLNNVVKLIVSGVIFIMSINILCSLLLMFCFYYIPAHLPISIPNTHGYNDPYYLGFSAYHYERVYHN